MELRHLRYFLAVAEELHFGHAAAKLHMAQPPLSQQIKRLEEELGLSLFQRTRRKVQLTPAGAVFREEARQTVAQAEHAVRSARRAQQGEIGQLVVGFVDSAVYHALPPVLRAFRGRFPDVELVLRELNPAEQFLALRSSRLDAGFVRSVMSEADLAQEEVFEEPLIAALPHTHALARRRRILLRDLAGQRFVFFPRALGPGFYDQVVSLCQSAGFSFRVVQEANEMQTIVSLVAAGIGGAIVPASIRNLRMPGVSYVALADPAARTALRVTWRREDTSPVLQAFLKVVREVARHRHAGPGQPRSRRARALSPAADLVS
ncbi:MAG TPA: LysR substrate-binding domain-containing protein [Terriglobia bacterium]|nr:LysR substrate-binding domain-containing protein [Terriglobia bacterium]